MYLSFSLLSPPSLFLICSPFLPLLFCQLLSLALSVALCLSLSLYCSVPLSSACCSARCSLQVGRGPERDPGEVSKIHVFMRYSTPDAQSLSQSLCQLHTKSLFCNGDSPSHLHLILLHLHLPPIRLSVRQAVLSHKSTCQHAIPDLKDTHHSVHP